MTVQKQCTCILKKILQVLKVVKVFLKHPALQMKVALNFNYPRENSVCFATLWQLNKFIQAFKVVKVF
jgi:hypothetical protein